MIPSFWVTMLDNVSNLLIKPVSSVMVSTPDVSLWIFALPFTSKPFHAFWLHSFKIVFQVCSISPKVITVSQIWILHIAANSRVRLFSICLKFRPIFLCVKIFCKETVGCWAKYNWWVSAATKIELCLFYKKVWLYWKKLERKYLNRPNIFFSKFTMIPTFWTPLLDNTSKLLIEP